MDTRTSGRGPVRHTQPRGRQRRTRAALARSLAAGTLLALALVSPALAHAELDSADPADGAVLDTAPTAITLTFTEGLDTAKSSFRVLGPDGDTEAATGAPAKDGRTTMRAADLTLAPGTYTIRWTAAAADGHIERGTLTFTVNGPTPAPATPTPGPTEPPSAAPPSATPAPVPPTTAPVEPTPAPSADTAPASSSGGDVLLPIIAALTLVAVIGAVVLRRNRAS